jgi:segregation and condensation protein B
MTDKLPELKEIVGALVFGAGRPLGVRELHRCIAETARNAGGPMAVFAEVREADVREALAQLDRDVAQARLGFHVREIGGDFRLQSDPSCGAWLKEMLKIGPANRLSRPALETLSIIAYRQPITRAEIEKIRGVNVDHIIRMLMEMQLIRISGRSDLPGRPFLLGTTQTFLEHFGLKDLKDLGDLEPLLRPAGGEGAKPAAETAPETSGTPPVAPEAGEPVTLPSGAPAASPPEPPPDGVATPVPAEGAESTPS